MSAATSNLKWEDIKELAKLREENPTEFKNKVHWIETALTELSLSLLEVSLKVDKRYKEEMEKEKVEMEKKANKLAEAKN